MKPAWRTCGNCVNYEPFGDGGECRKDAPTVPTVGHSGRYPQVSYTEAGCGQFVLNGQMLFDRIEELQTMVTRLGQERDDNLELVIQLTDMVTELERERDGAAAVTGRIPLTTVEG